MNTKKLYQDINSKTVDNWVKEGWEWGTAVDHETFMRAKDGDWNIVLSPKISVPHDWFGDLKGKKLLGLASGGGQQIPIMSAAGAICTVMDYSDEQLKLEKLVAERESYDVDIVKADMTKRFPFEDESFDIIINPVSNCYIDSLDNFWKECSRVLKKGGILMVGFDNGFNYIVDLEEKSIIRGLPFNPLKDEELYKYSIDNDWGIQFSHTIEEQLQGQLDAGFTLTNIFQDINSEGNLAELNVPTFYVTRCIKR